jgi:hypothetical protein
MRGPKTIGFWEGLFCLVALFGTVVLAGAVGGAIAPEKPHSYPPLVDNLPSNDSKLAQADLVAQQEMADWAFGAMIGGFLTMIGSFAALYFIRETLQATQDTLQEARDRNAIEMRAYVVVIPKGIEQDVGSFEFRGQVEIHNIGKTPAHNVSTKVRMKTSDFHESNFKTNRFKNLAQRTLLPDARMRQGTKNTGLVSDFMDQSEFIFVYGRVDYTDYLQERRSTMFCHRYNKATFECEIDVTEQPKEPKVLIRTDMARHHIHGNQAD